MSQKFLSLFNGSEKPKGANGPPEGHLAQILRGPIHTCHNKYIEMKFYGFDFIINMSLVCGALKRLICTIIVKESFLSRYF